MIPEKLREVLKHEGVAAIVSQGNNGPHVVNTWNSYLTVTHDQRLISPVGGMNKTESNIRLNNKVLMTLGSREVQGFYSPGTGFLITGTASFIFEGEEFDRLKQQYGWARALLEIKPDSVTQTL